MQEFIIDTEFVSTQKDKYHYLEIAMLDPNCNDIYDYHFNIKLNNWEQNYIKRATSGKYGKRTQEVFKSVEKLYNGSFKAQRIEKICQRNNVKYKFKRMEHIKNVDVLKNPCTLYAWDTSSDQKIKAEFDHDEIEFIDVQSIWIRRFGGNQLSLSNAYKYVLFNTNRRDTKNLIEVAHFACVDVLMLKEVIEFTKTFDKQLMQIPILKSVRDQKINELQVLIENWSEKIESLKRHLIIETNPELIENINNKIYKLEQKIATKKNVVCDLKEHPVYEQAWWK